MATNESEISLVDYQKLRQLLAEFKNKKKELVEDFLAKDANCIFIDKNIKEITNALKHFSFKRTCYAYDLNGNKNYIMIKDSIFGFGNDMLIADVIVINSSRKRISKFIVNMVFKLEDVENALKDNNVKQIPNEKFEQLVEIYRKQQKLLI